MSKWLNKSLLMRKVRVMGHGEEKEAHIEEQFMFPILFLNSEIRSIVLELFSKGAHNPFANKERNTEVKMWE